LDARRPWLGLATAVLTVLLGGGIAQAADISPSAAGAPPSLWWVPCVAVALLCAAIGVWLLRRLQRLEAQASDLRLRQAQATTLSRVLDVWQWRTDARHRLLALEAPMGHARPAADPGSAGGLDNIWASFAGIDPDTGGLCPNRHALLRQRLEAQQAVEDFWVSHHAADDHVVIGTLRALPLHDADGVFLGHVGTLRDHPSADASARPEQPPTAAPASAPQRPAPMPSLTPLAIPIENDADSFSYTVSHDLRAPIRVVEGFTKIVKEDYGRLLDRVGNDHLDRVLGAAARMNSMIDALLALSQLTAKPVSRQPVNLSQLAGFVVDDLRRQSPQHKVTVHIDPGMQVQGDPTLLRVVLENLLGNAWKYTGKCTDPHVWFERGTDTTNPCFTVRDNGAGFDMRFADRLFGVFQRLHSASEFQGTGVGLASVRRIVHKHGGEVWADSAVGQGASFHFSLAPPSH
jgi:signal transduction histidine kinase